MKIAVYSAHLFEMPYLLSALEKGHELMITEKELNEKTVHLSKSASALTLFTSDKVNESILKQLATYGIKYISLRSVGFDHVDLKIAKELHIKVANVPAYSPYSVAEHAVTLLMALNRRLIQSRELIKLNDFRLNGLTGFDVHSKTVGIVGFGKIGQAFARIMNGFGCKLLCCDPSPDYELGKETNLQFVSFNELCGKSDIISIHCPLNTSTKYLFDTAAFSIMKKGAFLINTARGPIIKTEDLLLALDKGLIGAAGLDVYEFEKGLFFNDHRNEPINDPLFEKLRTYNNVLITGHQAFLTETALKNIADTTAYNLKCFEQGNACINEL